jgi:hypothetical protein
MLKVPDEAEEEPEKEKPGFWSSLFTSKKKT